MSNATPVVKFQIGKAGVNAGVITAIEAILKTHKQIRITVLKSSGRTRETIKTLSDSIINQLQTHCICRIIGFTIVLSRRGSEK